GTCHSQNRGAAKVRLRRSRSMKTRRERHPMKMGGPRPDRDAHRIGPPAQMWMNAQLDVTCAALMPSVLTPQGHIIALVTLDIPVTDLPVKFTDNGVIIFRRNFYDPVYNMKYPYNFYDYDYFTPPMIAVFWADADFSRMGELYYQTYDFQASPYQHTDFKTKLESEIKSYFPSLPVDFKALWAIKITWHQVPPYPGISLIP
ncbi:unnamed protein product, partial [Ranitomeya imitator]